MAEARIIDYYAILSLPPSADIQGITNAYARLSDELATAGAVDNTSADALTRLNEAYTVLSTPEMRRKYDAVYHSADKLAAAALVKRQARRRNMRANMVVAALLLIVGAQVCVLGYLGREHVSETASVLLGPLMPGQADAK